MSIAWEVSWRSPFKLYLEVFFLLQNKHVMVEELLQLLIAEVDAQLLEPVELKRRIFVKILCKIITFLLYCTVLVCFTLCYREDKVLGGRLESLFNILLFYSRLSRLQSSALGPPPPPPPHPQSSLSLPLVQGWRTHSLGGEGGSQFRGGDRHCGTLGTYVCTFCSVLLLTD